MPLSLTPPHSLLNSALSCNRISRKCVLIQGRSYFAPRCITRVKRKGSYLLVASGSSNVSPLENWFPEKISEVPSVSDILWPSIGGFVAMALMGKIDQILASRGLSITIAPFGAVSAVLFATPAAPSARKYNMFVAQIGCAAVGVLSYLAFGSGWLARSTALASSLAFMIITRALHPPAASLPLLFIDGAKFHDLNLWYAVFPGAAGCIILCFIVSRIFYLHNEHISPASFRSLPATDGILLEEECEILSSCNQTKL